MLFRIFFLGMTFKIINAKFKILSDFNLNLTKIGFLNYSALRLSHFCIKFLFLNYVIRLNSNRKTRQWIEHKHIFLSFIHTIHMMHTNSATFADHQIRNPSAKMVVPKKKKTWWTLWTQHYLKLLSPKKKSNICQWASTDAWPRHRNKTESERERAYDADESARILVFVCKDTRQTRNKIHVSSHRMLACVWPMSFPHLVYWSPATAYQHFFLLVWIGVIVNQIVECMCK